MAKTEMLCVGCGINVLDKPADRRNLETDSSRNVMVIWKRVMLEKLQEMIGDDDSGVQCWPVNSSYGG